MWGRSRQEQGEQGRGRRAASARAQSWNGLPDPSWVHPGLLTAHRKCFSVPTALSQFLTYVYFLFKLLNNSTWKLHHFCISPIKIFGGINATKTLLLRAAFCHVHEWETLSKPWEAHCSQIASSTIPKTSCSPSPAPDFRASNGWKQWASKGKLLSWHLCNHR